MKDKAKQLRAEGHSFKSIMEELGLEKFKQVEYLVR
jgi:hypothetical protein